MTQELPPLPKRQADVLVFLMRQTKANGFAPSITEICEALNIRSTSTVGYHLDELSKKGYIRRIGPRAYGFHESFNVHACPHCGKAISASHQTD